METLEILRRRIESTERLHSVVRTMKILSLTSIRQYEEAVRALADYDETVEMGLQVVLQRRPLKQPRPRSAPGRHPGVLVFGAAQAMCGRFNEEIAAYAAAEVRALDAEQLIVLALGELVARHLDAVGLTAAQQMPVPETVDAITSRVQELVVAIERWRAEEGVDQVLLYYNKLHSGTTYDPYARQLLPLDADWLERLRRRGWPTRQIPLFTMDGDQLLSALVRQYVFVSLYRAFAESLASEHASRMAAMQVAEENIEERLDALESRFHRQRQHTITGELLDIMSGFEALTAEGSR